MESVINKLTEIEAAASGILEGAANQNKVLDQQHSERIAAFDQKLDADTVRRLQNVQSELKNRTDTELLHLRSGTARSLSPGIRMSRCWWAMRENYQTGFRRKVRR